MAEHAAIQIRDAVVTAVTGLTTTGSRVFVAHTRDDALVPDTDLPALVVLTPREEVIPEGLSKVFSQRRSTIEIVAIADKTAAAGDLGKRLFTIVKEVEIALAAPIAVAGRSLQFVVNGEMVTESSELGGRVIGMLILPFLALYYVDPSVPDAVL